MLCQLPLGWACPIPQGPCAEGCCLEMYSTQHRKYIMPHPRVASLHVYPVKGCKGIEVKAAYFERTGKFAERYPCMLHAACATRKLVLRSGIRSHMDGSPGAQRKVHYAATEAQVCLSGRNLSTGR